MGLRVLLVDDLADHRHGLRRRLEGERATVIEAGTGRDALNRAEAQPFDIALIDLGLPDISDEALIGALARTANSAVAAISAIPREDLARAIAAGAERVFSKPVDWDQLLRYLEMGPPTDGKGKAGPGTTATS